MITASAGMICSVPATFCGTRRPRGTGRPEPRLDDLHALDLLGADDLDRLAVEEELDALFRLFL